ncbi:TetR/AcrR family transcriptional regulator [Ruegeria sp. Ofav3-42]|nr:TetR/AcrR family transcriptional regulator [Ruegeria sp. Ofav3-42]
MGDIAAEAGIVRQTIYSFFKNKDEVLCAAIQHYSDQSLAKIHKDWERSSDLGDKLDAFFEHAILSSFAIVSATPDARDMIGGFNAAGKAATERAQSDKIGAWKKTLADHSNSSITNISTDRLAECIVLSSLGLRDRAEDVEQLRDLLEIQKLGIVSMLK